MENSIDTERTLELLADPYARDLLERLTHEPMSAPELEKRCSFSRTTVYRRLEQLEAAGLVTVTLELRRNGNHRRLYRPAIDELTISLDDQEIEGQRRQAPQTA